MEAFPPEPDRFVGRAHAMAKAGAVLAPDSGYAGVLLHGMAGSGKTACALELAYRHQDSFQAVAFWQASLADDEFGGALASLAIQLDMQLGEFWFAMSDKITTVEMLTRFTPRLRRLLEDNGILLVLDNLETLLTTAGTWRDPRWEPLISALTGHGGESRIILTSRIPPAGLADSAVLALPVHALDLAESVALARELPGLRGLLHADVGPERDADRATAAADRELVRRVLHVVQGHPKLMELADAAATAGPTQLTVQLDAAETAASGQVLDAFFRDGATALDGVQFLDTLTTWTAVTLGQLPAPARLMAQILACLEEGDRQPWIIDAIWADLWHRLSQPGDPPNPAPLLGALTAAALMQLDPLAEEDQASPASVTYRMHPGIAQAIRATAPGVQAATDTELAATWQQVFDDALRQEGGGSGQAIIRAGRAAVPYLLRLQQWDTASFLLSRVLNRDDSLTTIQAVLPALRAIANATRTPGNLGLLADNLTRIDPAEAETLMRASITQAAANGDFKVASTLKGGLVSLLKHAGRLREALELAGQMAEYTLQSGGGPWDQLGDQGRQLQILGLMGQNRQVVDQVTVLKGQMDKLPSSRTSNDAHEPWNVRELILDAGSASAQVLEEWQTCLDFNAAILASMRDRGASAYAITKMRYNDARPLIGLGRLADAELILLECQQADEDQNDIAELQKVLSTRAFLEDVRGRPQQALALQRTAVRLAYARPEPPSVAIKHHQFAYFLKRAEASSTESRAHTLAAALLYQFTGMTAELSAISDQLARELRRDTECDDLPGTVDEVVDVAEQTEGVHLDRLITALQPDRQAAANALTSILRVAADTDPRQEPTIQDYLQRWESVIAATVATAGGDSAAAAQLMPFLDEAPSYWAALVTVLRRIIGGDRDASLLQGLDSVGTEIAGCVLARLAQPSDTPTQED
jgi:hypothetical protein